MNDERRSGDDPFEDEEDKGLGLTEEFKRLEEEIGQEGGERRHVRFDETDSTEWVAPVERREPEPEPEAEAEPAVPEAEDEPPVPEAEDEAEPGSEAEPESGVEPDAEPAAEPDAEPAAEPEAEPAAEAEPGPDPEPEADSDAEPAAAAAAAQQQTDPPTVVRRPAEVLSDAPATEHTVVRDRPLAPAGAGGGAGGPYEPYTDEDIADKTPALWWRFMTASVMIIVATATAISLTSLLAFNNVLEGFQDPGVKSKYLDDVEPGDPFTILIVGSDKRTNTPGDPGRSDTTMLLRVDPQDHVLSLFSLPRDLKVDIPGYGTAKLNEAYTDGGINKTLETVKDLTDLDINYVVNVDFQGFADAVDAIGCVYVDVDRDYFNDNSAAVSAEEQYAAIDVNAGYQRLCGLNALDYVRYRHTDSDFVRSARQQDFLRNARAQVPASEILPIIGGDKSSDLLDIFTKYTATTIETPAQLIDMLRSFISVRDVPVKEVHFNGSDTIENGIAYVTASQADIDKAVQEFLGEEDSAGGPDAGPEDKGGDKDKSGGDKGGKDKGDKGDSGGDTSGADVISTEDNAAQYCSEFGGVDKVAAFGRTSARRLKFPVYMPTVVVPGSCYDPGSRQYDIKDTDDNKQAAYKLVLNLNSTEAAGEYYGVMGTEWSDPPILEKKSETITMGDRDYDLYYDGDRLRIVAFRSDGNSYWVSNTLLQSLNEDQMLAIAKSMTEAHGG